MIFGWLTRKRTATITDREKKINEWRENYFLDIVFPVVIFSKKDYLAVSDLLEYYYDVDINIWFVDSDCELADSMGQKYDFKQIEKKQWVPNSNIGTIHFNELKAKITPLLYMPLHKQGINGTKTIKDIIELLEGNNGVKSLFLTADIRSLWQERVSGMDWMFDMRKANRKSRIKI
jgi:hypothetical protein